MRIWTALSGVRRRNLFVAAGASLLAVSLAPGGPPAHASGSSVISGTVFQDNNRNGVLDSGEAGFSGQFVDLLQSNGAWVTSTQTDSTGHYSFAGLADGAYTVTVEGVTNVDLRDYWVMTNHPAAAPGYLNFTRGLTLSGFATLDFALRQIVRSSSPITTSTTPGGTVVNSYDDAVSAQDLATDLLTCSLRGAEQPVTTVNFDAPNSANDTAVTVSGSAGSYGGYQASVWTMWDNWLNNYDETLFHEYGHAWSEYYMYVVQQDVTLSSYLAERGLTGNPNLYTTHAWTPKEMIAEDYRQLFGSPSAAAFPQENGAIPPAAQISGLKSWLQSVFTQAPPTVPAPTVSALSPSAGPASGGTTVTVTGSNFSGPGWSVRSVTFGGVPATSFTVVSPTQVTAVAPQGSGQANVTVTTAAQSVGAVASSSANSADMFSWIPTPVVQSISPTSGRTKGGTTVTITGTGFSGYGISTVRVSFGGTAAGQVTVVSSTQLTVVSPPSAAGSINVTVTTSGGTSAVTPGDVFTYTRH